MLRKASGEVLFCITRMHTPLEVLPLGDRPAAVGGVAEAVLPPGEIDEADAFGPPGHVLAEGAIVHMAGPRAYQRLPPTAG